MSIAEALARGFDEVALSRELGIEPDAAQAAILRSTADRIALLCHRQWGKSTVAATKALAKALYTPKSLVVLVSPSQRQSSELFRKVLVAYRALGRPLAPDSENRLSLELETGSRIVSLPGSESTIRGYSAVNLLIVDEAARVDEDTLSGVMPAVSSAQGQVIILTTPGMRHTWAFKVFEESSAGWEVHRIPASSSGRIPDEELERQRQLLGDWKYQIEYELRWAGDEDTLFRPDLIEAMFQPGVGYVNIEEALNA